MKLNLLLITSIYLRVNTTIVISFVFAPLMFLVNLLLFVLSVYFCSFIGKL